MAAKNVTCGDFNAWSDSCLGQDMNFFSMTLWQFVIHSGRFKSVEHKFPDTGHIYMDSYRDFAPVEN